MDNTQNHVLIVDLPEPGVLELHLGEHSLRMPYTGHVDNLLLTAVDKLLQEHTIDKSAITAVQAGPGVDKNSSLYRIVTSFASAIAATRQRQK
jgi:hypothetical protein